MILLNGIFSIASNAEVELSGELKVINLLGKVVYMDRQIHMHPGSVRVITIGDMAPGHYILVFTNENLSINRKLIITCNE